MAQWKLALMAPHAAALTLLVAGLAQWVYFVCDRWHRMLPVWYRAGHVNMNVAQHRFRHRLTCVLIRLGSRLLICQT
jgi:hypothetical protein